MTGVEGYIFQVEFAWGIQARMAGRTKTSPSFMFPPPTTVLGAIARGYAARMGLSESDSGRTLEALAGSTLALGVRPLNVLPSPVADLNRIIVIGQRKGVKYPNPVAVWGSFDAPARGKTYYYVDDGAGDGAPTLSFFLVTCAGSILEDDIWRITRIGSKESVVSVVDVRRAELEVISGRGTPVRTGYSVPVEGDLSVDVRLSPPYVEHYAPPWSATGAAPSQASLSAPARYYVPRPGKILRVTLDDRHSAYRDRSTGDLVVGIALHD
ncbi:MAG: CRISPR-associated protein Cas5 [Anaerolineae bacterium]|jgi:CRISPR-associated protein Cas5a/b/c